VYPLGNVYCGSKFAVDAITRGTRIDLLSHSIKVTQIAPGAANTEFSLVRFKGDRDRADQVYNGFHPLEAEDVAEAVIWLVDGARTVTGELILLDSGMHLGRAPGVTPPRQP